MKTFLKTLAYLKPYLKPLVLANSFMLLFVVFSTLSVALLMPFVDLLFGEVHEQAASPSGVGLFNLKHIVSSRLSLYLSRYSRIELLQYLCLGIVCAFLLKNLFSYLQTYYMAIVEQGVIKDIRFELYRHLHKLSLGYFTEEKKGNLISRIVNDVRIINDSAIAVINSIFRDPPLIITYSLVLFIFNWKLTLLVFALLPLTGVILSKIGDSLKRRSIRSQEKIAEITTILDETLGAMRIVKAFNMEKFEVERFNQVNQRYASLLTSLGRRRALAGPITEYLGVLVVAVILYFIGYEIVTGKSDMTPGAFVFYVGVVFQLMPPLKLFGQVFNSVQEGIAAGERVFNVLDTKPKIFNKSNAIQLEGFSREIEFKNVFFKYETSDYVLTNINCKIRAGEIVAIVGPSGAGKSSLVDLIPRFYDVTDGSILIDGHDIRNIQIESIRSLMGIVTQETILFNDTLKNNILYGSNETAFERVVEVAKAANAHDFISGLEKGYETVIGDRGVKLSGGERQRISIARALLKNPPILLLDEATSALDTESELLVQQAIDRLMEGRTSVIIAHRLSTVQNADRILVLDEGEIVEEGRHEDLLRIGGLYQRLYDLQFK
jgi:subfamily B ATP-binding cassette protein MsbA